MKEQFAPTRHELKILPVHFDAVEDGVKTFELRLNDRDYKVGDVLWLKEWDDDRKIFTGRVLQRRTLPHPAWRSVGPHGWLGNSEH